LVFKVLAPFPLNIRNATPLVCDRATFRRILVESVTRTVNALCTRPGLLMVNLGKLIGAKRRSHLPRANRCSGNKKAGEASLSGFFAAV
jgi:hypothetical protein